jgi:hypothetical protein
MWLKLRKNEQKLTKKHKPTFLIHLLPRNEDQNLPLIFLRNMDLQNRLQWKLAASIQFTVGGKKRGIYNRQFTGGWLEKPPVEISYFHWQLCYTNRQWKLVSTCGSVTPTASGNILFPLVVVLKITASGNRFPLAVPKPGPSRFFLLARDN